MGTPIIVQRRGKGSLTYKANSHKFLTKLKYPEIKQGIGKIKNIVKDVARGTPLLLVELNNEKFYLIACEGLSTKDNIYIKQKLTNKETLKKGMILPLCQIPEGTPVFNIESQPNDGGKFIRSCGSFGLIVSHDKNKTIIKMQSKKQKTFNPNCRATVGIVAGGKIKSKPFVKAGTKYHKMKTKGKLYPRTSPTNMNAIDHKYGGQNFGKQKTISRNAPPGRKIGNISARRTGKKR